MPFAFLIAGVVLLAFETHHQALYAGCLAVSCFATSIAAFAQSSLMIDGATFVVVLIVCLLLIRPALKKILDRRTPAMQAFGVHIALLGQAVITEDEVGDEHHSGHVRLGHERWLAISTGSPIAAGTEAVVKEVRGTTLVVEPKEGN